MTEPSTACVGTPDQATNRTPDPPGTRTAMLIFAGLGLLGLVVVAVDLHRSLRSIEAVPESALDGRRLDPGGATLAEWTLVPGIGPSVAGRIDAARRDGRLGPLQSVSGVGPITLREAAPYLVHPSAAGFRRGSGR